MNKSDKDPFKDMSSVNDNVLRPWARNPETDVKLDNAINGLNNILQMSAPQKFSGKQGYSSLDRTPDRIIALYEFAKSHPDWVDSFLDGMPASAMPDRGSDENMLTVLENNIQDQDCSDSAGSEDGGSSVEYSDEEGAAGDLLGDVDVLEAAFGLSGIADTLGPDFSDSFNDKRYLPNGNARFEADAQRRHSCYSRSKRLNKSDRKKADKQYASARFVGKYRLSNSSLSLLPPQRQSKKKRRSWKSKLKHRNSAAEVNILTINEAEPTDPDPPRPMTAEEFYDNSLDLLQPEATLSSTFSESNYFSRPGTASRPPTGYLQSGAAQLRAVTPSGIPPSPLTSQRSSNPLNRPGTGVNRPYSSDGRPGSAVPSTERPSTAELPLLRPGTADRASGNQSRQSLFSPTARTTNTSKSLPPNGGAVRRPSTANSTGNRPSTTSSASRYEAGGIGGLAVVSRPQSRDGRTKGPTSKQTTYSDTAAQFFESGKTDNKFQPFVHREMSKLRSVRDQMRTMEGRMLAFSGNLGAVMDNSKDEYIQRKTTGVTPGGVEFTKKSLFPLDAQRKMTERIYRDAKVKAAVDHVEPRLKCDGYDRVVPPEKLYQSETQKFIVNNDSYDNMRKTVRQGGFHIKQGELQEYAEEAQRLGKRPFEVGPGGMKC